MSVNLKDLGTNFTIQAINDGNGFSPTLTNNTFLISPGTYILSKKGVKKNWNSTDKFKTTQLNAFYAPESNLNKAWLKHEKRTEITENSPLKVTIQYISPENPKEIMLTGNAGFNNFFNLKMTPIGKYNYSATISADKLKKGYLTYNFIVTNHDDSKTTYPSGEKGSFYDWDFYNRDSYKVPVVSKEKPIILFNAIDDSNLLVRQWRPTFKLEPTDKIGEAEYQIYLEKLTYPDNENSNAKLIYDYTFKHFITNKIEGRESDLSSKSKIVFYGRALNNKSCKLQIAFVLNDGASFGKTINIDTELKEYSINLDELEPVKTVTLPRPYPSFLPYYLNHDLNSTFDLNKIESIQFSIGPGISENDLENQHGIGIISIELN